MEIRLISIIVTYNVDLTEFEKSFINHITKSEEVSNFIVVDNGSDNANKIRDLAYNKLFEYKKNKEAFEFIKLNFNMGIAYAQNVGINRAIALNCSHVILFDQDSHITNGMIKGLLDAETRLLGLGFNVGAVGPTQFDTLNKQNYTQIIVDGIKTRKLTSEDYHIDDSIAKVSFIIASGSLFRIGALREVGLMKEEYFIDCVDIEWSFRASRLGYNIFITKSAILNHNLGDYRAVDKKNNVIPIHSPLRKFYETRNRIFMIKQSYIPFGYKLSLIYYILIFPMFLRYVVNRKQYFSFYLAAIRNGVLGISGKYSI